MRPASGFPVLLADPPWYFETRSDDGREKCPQYRTMSVEEICALPVKMLLARHAAAFIWFTWPLMPFWCRILDAWGLEYAGLAWEWIKFNPETGKYAFGPGYGTRKNLEPCLLATKGDPQLRRECRFFGDVELPEGARSVRDFIEWNPFDCIRSPRREHSRKPDDQYERIETMFQGPYCELFSRTNRKGWTAWGDDAGKFGEVA